MEAKFSFIYKNF